MRLDYRSRRGFALGFESDINYGKDEDSFAKLKSYFLQDQNPELNRTNLPRGTVPTSRYRFSLQDRTYFNDAEDIYALVNVTKLSDAFVMQDFYQSEFRSIRSRITSLRPRRQVRFTHLMPSSGFRPTAFSIQPSGCRKLLSISNGTLFLADRSFMKAKPASPICSRNFAVNSGFQDYGTFRADTFHQLIYPNTYFGWLSLVPRVGFRGTYYGETRDLGHTFFTPGNPIRSPQIILLVRL